MLTKRSRILSAGFVAGLLLDFVSSALADDQGELQFRGAYRVPIDDTDLDPAFAEFDVAEVEVKVRGSAAAIEYSFPKALDGNGQYVELKGVATSENKWDFSGPTGTLSCAPNDQGSIECTAYYPGLVIDKTSRDAYLQSVSKTPAEFSARGQVAQIFEGERIGVLSLSPLEAKK